MQRMWECENTLEWIGKGDENLKCNYGNYDEIFQEYINNLENVKSFSDIGKSIIEESKTDNGEFLSTDDVENIKSSLSSTSSSPLSSSLSLSSLKQLPSSSATCLSSQKIIMNPLPAENVLDAYNNLCIFRKEEKYIILPDKVREKIELLLYDWIDKNPTNRIMSSNSMGLALTLYAHAVHHICIDWNRFVDIKYDDDVMLRIFRSYKNCIPEPGTLMGEIVAQFFQHCKQQSNLNVKRTMNKQHSLKNKIEDTVLTCGSGVGGATATTEAPTATTSTTTEETNNYTKNNLSASNNTDNSKKRNIDSKFEVIMSLKRVPTVIIMISANQINELDICKNDYVCSGGDDDDDNNNNTNNENDNDYENNKLENMVLDNFRNKVMNLHNIFYSKKQNIMKSTKVINKYKNNINLKNNTLNSKTKNSIVNKSIVKSKNKIRKKVIQIKKCKKNDYEILLESQPEYSLKQFYNKKDTSIYLQITFTRKGHYDQVLDEFFKIIYEYNRYYSLNKNNDTSLLFSDFNIVFCSDTLYFMNMSKRLFIDNSIIFLYCYLTDKYKPVIDTRDNTDTFGLVKMMSCIEYCTQSSLKRHNNSKIGHGPLTSVISEGGLNESIKFVNNLLRKKMLNNNQPSHSSSSSSSPTTTNTLASVDTITSVDKDDVITPKRMFVINEPYINTFLNKPVDCGNMY